MYFSYRTSRGRKILQLLESYRNADGKPRNRVVVSLGQREMSAELKEEVADLVEAELYQRPLLFPASDKAAAEAQRVVREVYRRGKWVPVGSSAQKKEENAEGMKESTPETIDGVLLDQVSTRQTTSLGPELVGLHAWNELNMDGILDSLGFNPAQKEAACVQVLGRLVAPGSELALAERFLDGSSLPDLLGLKNNTPITTDRYYRVSDKLLANRDAIETHTRRIVGQRLSLTRTYYLYDLTNTHFEGTCEANPKACRGKNKQKRNDCPQVSAGVCFDEYGFVLFHRLFPGNQNDAASLPKMIKAMQKCADEDGELQGRPTVILDGGLASEANLEALREAGLYYLVNRTRSYRSKLQEAFSQDDAFESVPGRDVQVRKMKDPEGDDELILCRSMARGEKESAIRNRADERLTADLEKLNARVTSGRLKDTKKINQAIGRLRERHSRVGRYYEIKLNDAGELTWKRNDAEATQAGALDGCYVLQAHGPSLSAVDFWHQYMVLTKAENGFRAFKGHLGLRPNFHRLEHRVDGHIFITVLAYQLMRFILHRLEAAGDHRSWPVIRQILQSHCYATIEMPTVSGTTWRLRQPGKPEPLHRSIYQRLQINWLDLPREKIQFQTSEQHRNP